MYTALYRQKRPEVFDDLLGQEHIVKILKHQIREDAVSHAYLFCGTRGTGKTTVARILAKAVNCLSEGDKPCGKCANCKSIKEGSFIDVIEIDAASNNSVDNIRELKESIKYPPAIGKKKVYIIDEAHMLSTGASNALLKTLEEPPENVIFILATTDPQKLIPTILSRCIKLDFRLVSQDEIGRLMNSICSEQGVETEDGAIDILASKADGSVRDGLSLLEQCLSSGEKLLTRDRVLDFLGIPSDDFFIQLTDRVMRSDSTSSLALLDEILRNGKDVKQLMLGWLNHYRNLLLAKHLPKPEKVLPMSLENVRKIKNQADAITMQEINDGILLVSRTINDSRYSSQPRVLMELAIVTLATGIFEDTTTVLVEGKKLNKKPIRTESSILTEPEETVIRKEKKVENVRPQLKEAKIQEKKVEDRLEEREEPKIQVYEAEGSTFVNREEPRSEDILSNEVGSKNRTEEYSQEELDNLWERVFDLLENDNSSLYLIRISTTLGGISSGEFKVLGKNKVVCQLVERKKAAIEETMERLVGRKLIMVVREEDSAEKERDDSKEKVIQRLKDLGLTDLKVK